MLIEDMFRMENEKGFLIFKFFAENTDNFFRFFYITIFGLYFCLRMAELYNLLWL